MEELEMDNNLTEIKEFIKLWKERAINYYTDKITYYYNKYKSFCSYICKFHNSHYAMINNGTMTEEEYKIEYDKLEKEYKSLKEEMAEELTQVFALDILYYSLNNCIERMIKKVEKDAIAKENQLIARVNKQVGCIIKANELYVGVNGELNGYIQGENGVCKIETIYAGGYNIQCYTIEY
jgi:hypothetical protein